MLKNSLLLFFNQLSIFLEMYNYLCKNLLALLSKLVSVDIGASILMVLFCYIQNI